MIKMLKPSKRGEYELTDVNNIYIHLGQMDYKMLKGYWQDAGTFDGLFKASKLVKGE
jgi:glucose-1-phosphate thymidylyltransferase